MEQLLAAITWRPAIGDPDPLGWCITLSYLAAGLFCVLAGRRQRTEFGERPRHRWIWFVLAALMLGLGFNKQLDLQTLLTQVGREVAKQGGWFTQRKRVQSAFVFVGAGLGVAGLAVGLYVIRGRWRQFGLAYLGVVLLLAFVVIRAASQNKVDKLLNRIPAVSHWTNVLLELGGASLVGVGAIMAARQKKFGPGTERVSADGTLIT